MKVVWFRCFTVFTNIISGILSLNSSLVSGQYFFISISTMNKDHFMQQLNRSYVEDGLTCGFNDFQLAEFIQQKMRNAGRLVTKKDSAESRSTRWFMGSLGLISTSIQRERLIKASLSTCGCYLFDNPGISSQHEACPIKQPLTTESLHALVQYLAATMEHNFIPSLMVLGSAWWPHITIRSFLLYPTSLPFGESGTGKTTALRCGLAITGVYPSRFYSRALLEKYSELCSTNCLPLWLDDPKSKPAINDLTIALFNRAICVTTKRGKKHHLQWQLVLLTSQPQRKK